MERMCILQLFYGVLYMSIRLSLLIQNIFIFTDIFIYLIYSLLGEWTKIFHYDGRFLSLCSFINFLFIYFEAILLSTFKFRIVINILLVNLCVYVCGIIYIYIYIYIYTCTSIHTHTHMLGVTIFQDSRYGPYLLVFTPKCSLLSLCPRWSVWVCVNSRIQQKW